MGGTNAVNPALTIAIISSQYLVRLGLQTVLENGKSGYIVYGYQRMTPEILLSATHPDVFMLDLETERDALGTITQIRETVPNSKIVLLCGLEDTDRTREAFVAGAHGIILKVQPPTVVLAVIEALDVPTNPQTPAECNGAGRLGLGPFLTKPGESKSLSWVWPEALTEREREIIRLVGRGLSNKDIAYELSISDSTVRHHLTNIFDKVGVPNRQKLLIRTHHVSFTPVEASEESVSAL